MALYGTILCAIDFSEPSREALGLGLRLGARIGARVVAVHVVDTLLAEAAAVHHGRPALIHRIEDELRAFVAAQPASTGTTSVVRTGSPHEDLLACAAEYGAGLIVMGTHGLGGLKKLFFGSVTERVLRETTVPVLAMSGRAETAAPAGEFTGVLAAVEVDASAGHVLAHAAALATALRVPLSVVHVAAELHAAPPLADAAERVLAERRQEATARLRDLVRTCGCDAAGMTVETGAPAEQIAHAASRDAGIIVVIGLGGRGVFHRPGSTAYRILCISSAPVLAVPGSAGTVR